MTMIHRESLNGEVRIETDPYLFNEEDPSQSHAMESSLWEIQTLKHHYCPEVATMAKIFEEPFTKPKFHIDQIVEGTYASVSVYNRMSIHILSKFKVDSHIWDNSYSRRN
jgi:U3 small nucleolar RNA-associated protein 19